MRRWWTSSAPTSTRRGELSRRFSSVRSPQPSSARKATSSYSRARSRRRSWESSHRLPRPPWFSWRSTTCNGSTPRHPRRSRSRSGGYRTGSACSSPGAAVRLTHCRSASSERCPRVGWSGWCRDRSPSGRSTTCSTTGSALRRHARRSPGSPRPREGIRSSRSRSPARSAATGARWPEGGHCRCRETCRHSRASAWASSRCAAARRAWLLRRCPDPRATRSCGPLPPRTTPGRDCSTRRRPAS